MLRRGVLLAALAAALAGVAGAASSQPAQNGGASARAYAIRIVLPNLVDPVVQAEAIAPPNAIGFLQAFAYPEDGSALKAGALTSSADAVPGPKATAQAASGISSLALFHGEITADTVSRRATATATQK